jgi:Holliday junction resolvase RusA-like endonuclease
MDRVAFTVPGNPVGKGRPRITTRGGKPRSYTPPATRAYEEKVAKHAKAAMDGCSPFFGACTLSVVAYMPIPASWSRPKKGKATRQEIPAIGRIDGDNILKAIGDACNAIVWRDDAQVTDARVVKRYGLEPRVEVAVVHLSSPERGVTIIPTETEEAA